MFVGVGVFVGVSVPVGVKVGVAVGVNVGVVVAVANGVFVGVTHGWARLHFRAWASSGIRIKASATSARFRLSSTILPLFLCGELNP